MRKTLIGLYVPAAQERFDLLVPADLNIETLSSLLISGVTELCNGRYIPSRQGMLTLRNPDMLLHPEKTLADYGIEDGAQLVLF